MNKIFKVVWSKVKHCYVVVSEIAKNTISGGARRSRVRKGALAAALVTTVLGSSFAMPNSAWAAPSYSTMGDMGLSYEALIVLSAEKDANGKVSFGIDLYRGDSGSAIKDKTETDWNGELKYPDGYVYLGASELAEVQRLYPDFTVEEGYKYTKVSSVGAQTEFTTVLQETINQTVVNDIVTMINSGQNAVAIPTYSQTQKTDSSGNLLFYDDDGNETTQNTNNPIYPIEGYTVHSADSKVTSFTNSVSGNNNNGTLVTAITQKEAVLDAQGRPVYDENSRIKYEEKVYTDNINFVSGGGKKEDGVYKDTYITISDSTNSFNLETGSKVVGITANGSNALTGLEINGKPFTISATDTKLVGNSSALTLDQNTGEVSMLVQDTSTDSNDVTGRFNLKDYIKQVAGEGTSVNNTTINQQITNIINSVENLQDNDIHSMVVAANSNDNGGTIDLLKSDGTNGAAGTAVASTLNFVSGGGAAVTSSDGNGATTTTYEDTWVKVYNAGNETGFSLATGSKVVGTGVQVTGSTGKSLSKININGEDFNVPVVVPNTATDDGALVLEYININGVNYKVAESIQGEGHDWSLTGEVGKANEKATDDTPINWQSSSYTISEDGKVKLNMLNRTTGVVEQDKVIIEGVASRDYVINNAGNAIYNQTIENGTTITTNINQQIANVTNSVNAGWTVAVGNNSKDITPVNKTLTFVGDGATTVSLDVDNSTIKIASTDTNTTYTSNGGIKDNSTGATTYTITGSDQSSYKIVDTDTNTKNQEMSHKWTNDDLELSVKDTDGNIVSTTVNDVARASNLKKETEERKEEDTILREAIINNQQNVQNLNAGLNKLGNRMNKVGAGSAALAALHPMDFDPDDKLQFSAGVGHYGGENAAALGAFYRPTEKVMFSVAGTMGNGEDMVNAGVTFALDKPNNVSNSRVAMAREIQDLRQQVAALTMLVMQMASRDNAALAGVAMFPDVPENHWAYDYIEGLQKQGIIEGYPDGNFGGDRSMTRYEFAAMLYRALEKGFPVDSRLLNEFNAELGRIRVDRIKGADNDANKVERVRVNNYEDRDDYGSKIVQVKAGA